MKRTLLALISCLIAGCLGPFAAIPALAATSAVTFSGPTEVTVGQVFQVITSISGAKDVDTIRLNGTFTPGLVELQTMVPLSLKSISPGNFTNQTTGIFSHGSFSVTDRLNGRANLAAFIFKAKKAGVAHITLDQDSWILSNGQILPSTFGVINVTIRDRDTKEVQQDYLLTLTSPTHPDGMGWRPQRVVEATWDAKNAKKTFIGFDRSPDGPANVEVTGNSHTFTADADGVWYVHLGAVFADGTFVKRTLTVLIDTEEPRAIEPSVDQTDVPSDAPNSLRFATLDDTAGVDHYDVRLSNGYSTSTEATALDLTALQLPPGEYTAHVTAYDRAGNGSSGDVTFHIAKPFVAEATPVQEAQSSRLIEWLYALGILTLILSLIFFYLGYHRRRRKRHLEAQGRK